MNLQLTGKATNPTVNKTINAHGFVLVPVLSAVGDPGVRWVSGGAERIVLCILLRVRYVAV